MLLSMPRKVSSSSAVDPDDKINTLLLPLRNFGYVEESAFLRFENLYDYQMIYAIISGRLFIADL